MNETGYLHKSTIGLRELCELVALGAEFRIWQKSEDKDENLGARLWNQRDKAQELRLITTKAWEKREQELLLSFEMTELEIDLNEMRWASFEVKNFGLVNF